MTAQEFADEMSAIARQLASLRESWPIAKSLWSGIPDEMRRIEHDLRELRVKFQQHVKALKCRP